MINLTMVNTIIHVVTLLFAYFLTIAPAGYFRAWMARRVGDSTAYEAGMMTLNPLVHVDIIGVIVLMLFGAGWGKFIPINPQNIYPPHRRLKLFMAYFSDAIAHVVLATGALLVLAALFGANFTSSSMIEVQLANSGVVVAARILVAYVLINVFLAMISLVINGVMLALQLVAERTTAYVPYFHYIMLLGPLLILLLFGPPLIGLITNGIVFVAESLAHLFGLLGK